MSINQRQNNGSVLLPRIVIIGEGWYDCWQVVHDLCNIIPHLCICVVEEMVRAHLVSLHKLEVAAH